LARWEKLAAAIVVALTGVAISKAIIAISVAIPKA
jgi:hypothetical protein